MKYIKKKQKKIAIYIDRYFHLNSPRRSMRCSETTRIPKMMNPDLNSAASSLHIRPIAFSNFSLLFPKISFEIL